MKRGLHLWDKGLRRVYEQLIANPDQPKANQLDLEKSVRLHAKTLRNALVANGHQKDVTEAEAQHNGWVPVTGALLELAKRFPSKSVSGAAEELVPEYAALLAVEERAKESGHEVFDSDTVKLLREAWCCLDNAYDCVGICVRSAGQSYDPVLAARLTLHSELRTELHDTPDGKPAHASRSRKSSKDKPESADKAATGNDTPANGENPPPANASKPEQPRA